MKIASLMLTVCILSACASAPIAPGPQRPSKSFDARVYIQQAEKATSEKRLYDALVQYRVAAVIEPNNVAIQQKIANLQFQTQERAARYALLGELFAGKNNRRAAEHSYLKALSYTPNDMKLVAKLEQLDERRIKAIQIAKLNRIKQQIEEGHPDADIYKGSGVRTTQEHAYLEMGETAFASHDWDGAVREIKKYLASNPRDLQATTLLVKATIHLSQERQKREDAKTALVSLDSLAKLPPPRDTKYIEMLAQLRRDVAESYYDLGVKLYRSDINAAITHLETAVRLDPNHNKAKLRLNSAYKIEKQLKRFVDSDS